jgi:hypothetical protein
MAKPGEQSVGARENQRRVETGEPGKCAWHFLGIGNWVLDKCQLPISPIGVCGKSIGLSPQKMPFALFGIFFEDKHVEMVEGDNLSQSFGKNARPFLRFATPGSVPQRYETALHSAEHRFPARGVLRGSFMSHAVEPSGFSQQDSSRKEEDGPCR